MEDKRRWGFLKRFVIHNGLSVYLDRLNLIITPWFSIKLHRIYRPDNQRDLHDHPWNFLSIVLWGSYIENTPDGERKHRWFNFKRASDLHSIRHVSRSPVWTLVFCGRVQRVWGFQTAEGWVPWYNYEKLMEA